MKLKTAKIIVEPVADTNARWLRALRGKVKQSAHEEIISVGSWEVLGRIFSPLKLQILATILVAKPQSIAELATLVGKNFKNVHTDVHFLAELGLIDLKPQGKNKRLTPIAKYSEIDLPFVA